MLLLDALIRFSAITMLILLAITAVRDIRPARSWPYLICASLSTAALFFSLSTPELALPHELGLLSGFLNVPNLIFVWLFALSVFQTRFRISAWHIIVSLIYTFPIFWFRAYQVDFFPQPPFILTIGVSIGSILLMVHLVWVILQERKGDLIEARKRARTIFVIVLVVVTVSTAIVDLYLIAYMPKWTGLIKATTIWPAVFAASMWILGTPKGNFIVDRMSQKRLSQEDLIISAKNQHLFKELQKLIKDNHIYLDSKMTVTRLAKDLGVTPHRLRALINQSLGYENFNQFMNALRIDAITEKFDDPINDHLPILTLALEGGFRSLSPFNKAFKDLMGQTPSQYRKTKSQRDRSE